MGEDGSMLRRRQLGGELRRLRGTRTIKEVVDELHRSSAWLSRIETAQEGAVIRPAELRELARIYGITDDQRVNQLLNLLTASTKRDDWWEPYKDVLPSGLETFVGLESDARREQSFEPLIVPGLLQTAAYARAMYAVDRTRDSAATERLVTMRLERQRALTRESARLELHAILDEAALRRVVGGPAVMREQIEHLLAAADLPNVLVQILPLDLGAHVGMAGAFSLLAFDENAIVYVDSPAGNLYLEKPRDVRRFTADFEQLSATAHDPQASASLLKRIAKDYAR
ncbi:helix-turn-helix domain-containing protein [Actinocrinis puniceicyclus]|uniref:Helix-turn-helix domain-containing protein n=1 Tax=Actinocrinis puniceicyclus TaxID=977794 RepID=A0A8J7WVN5_9ACTN|nr:helix-turn-helix transcriptional regulator [Actinocrinis puniceicyclus]MBS2966019.1 helix-turn-helix domain-containing protein [Actinocrinis puniceicyclus]